jgi:hypothetical protein
MVLLESKSGDMASAASITAPLIWTVLAARRDHVGTRGRPVASQAQPNR